MRRKVDYLLARLKAKQNIRKVKEARLQAQQEMTNATTNYSAQPTKETRGPGPGLPAGEQAGLAGDNGLTGQP